MMASARDRKIQMRLELKSVDVDVSPEAWVHSWGELSKWLKNRRGVWGAYAPLKDEAPVFELVKLTPWIDWVFPKIDIGGGDMSFWRLGPRGFAPGPFTQEPAADATGVAADELTGLVIPALAFDGRGYRLGRGGGYYDRYLVGSKAIRVGVVPKKRLVPEIPAEEFDLPVDFLATEDGVKPVV